MPEVVTLSRAEVFLAMMVRLRLLVSRVQHVTVLHAGSASHAVLLAGVVLAHVLVQCFVDLLAVTAVAGAGLMSRWGRRRCHYSGGMTASTNDNSGMVAGLAVGGGCCTCHHGGHHHCSESDTLHCHCDSFHNQILFLWVNTFVLTSAFVLCWCNFSNKREEWNMFLFPSVRKVALDY